MRDTITPRILGRAQVQFRLIYEGPLPSNGSKSAKQTIRRKVHPQLKELWTHEPLSGHAEEYLSYPPGDNQTSLVQPIGSFKFVPLVCETLRLLAELEIVLLRPMAPGALLRQGGDIDNQLKTLFDALRAPHVTSELPDGDAPTADEDPFHCLLDDDERIVSLSVEADRYLAAPSSRDVRVEIFVRTRPQHVTWGNLSLA